MRNYKLVVNAFLSAHRLYFNVVCQLFRFCLFMLVQEWRAPVPRLIFLNYPPPNVATRTNNSFTCPRITLQLRTRSKRRLRFNWYKRRRDRYAIFIRRNKIDRERSRNSKNRYFFLLPRKNVQRRKKTVTIFGLRKISHCIIIMWPACSKHTEGITVIVNTCMLTNTSQPVS